MNHPGSLSIGHAAQPLDRMTVPTGAALRARDVRVLSCGGMLYVVGRVRQPEKRKVDSSILSLTTQRSSRFSGDHFNVWV